MLKWVGSCALAVIVCAGSGAVAQMSGGMGQGNGPMHGQGVGTAAAMGMSGGMGMGSGMMNDLAVGPDGSVYVLRRLGTPRSGGMMQGGNAGEWKTELVAIDGRNGAEKWKLEIDAEMVSEPAFAKDGRLFVTAADIVRTQAGGTITVARKARLLVIRPVGTGASIIATADVESDVLSAPRIAPDESLVYATGFEMAGVMWNSTDNDSVPAGQSDLYAFGLDGSRKFKVTIGRAQFNLPPR